MWSMRKTSSTNTRRWVTILKYIFLVNLCLALIFEILWTFYICQAFREDLKNYDEDNIWRKEFYKSTRNFFVFTVILVTLAVFLGLAAVYTENKTLLMLFIALFVMEWGFELIGIYASGDKNVAIYKIICEAGKPGILLLSLAFLFFLHQDSNRSVFT